jgi:hypothetical protein
MVYKSKLVICKNTHICRILNNTVWGCTSYWNIRKCVVQCWIFPCAFLSIVSLNPSTYTSLGWTK